MKKIEYKTTKERIDSIKKLELNEVLFIEAVNGSSYGSYGHSCVRRVFGGLIYIDKVEEQDSEYEGLNPSVSTSVTSVFVPTPDSFFDSNIK